MHLLTIFPELGSLRKNDVSSVKEGALDLINGILRYYARDNNLRKSIGIPSLPEYA